MARSPKLVRLAAVLAVGCSGSGPAPIGLEDPPPMLDLADGSAPALPTDYLPEPPRPPRAPADPAPAAQPVLTPCPAGWMERSGPGDIPVTCAPWPDDADRGACAAHEAWSPGATGCEAVGRACPAGEWPEDLPANGVIHVRAGSDGGDGTRTAPYGTIAAATAAATEGSIIVLAPGIYPEQVLLPAGVTIRGACPAESVIDAPEGEPTAAVVVEGAGSRLRDLTITGALRGLWVNGADAHLRVEGVVVEGATTLGVEIGGGATLDAESLVVRGTHGPFGWGIQVHSGATAALLRTVIEQNAGRGVNATGESEVLLVDSAIVAQAGDPDSGDGGHCMWVTSGSSVVVQRSAMESCRTAGVVVQGEGTLLRLEDTVVRGILPQASDQQWGVGVFAQEGASITVRRALLEETLFTAIGAVSNSRVDVQDLVVRGTRGTAADGDGGWGVALTAAFVRLERAWIEDNIRIGVNVGADADFDGTDMTIRTTREPPSEGILGTGLQVGRGGRATIERAVVDDSHNIGVMVAGEAELLDLAIQGTRRGAEPDDGVPVALTVHDGAMLTAHRVHLADNTGMGLNVGSGLMIGSEPGRATVSDLTVQDTQIDGVSGRSAALQVNRGALSLERARCERNGFAGLIVAGTATLSDVVVRDNVGSEAAEATGEFPTFGGGIGIEIRSGSEVTAERILLDEVRGAGVNVLGPDAVVDLTDLDVRRTRTGGIPGSDIRVFGRALHATNATRVSITRVHVHDNHEASITAFFDAVVSMREALIERTRARCAPCDSGGGIGAGAYLGGLLDVSRFVIRGHTLAGIQAAREGAASLEHGVVADNPIGANVQSERQSFDALTRDVVYVGNGRNLDATDLPIPESHLGP